MQHAFFCVEEEEKLEACAAQKCEAEFLAESNIVTDDEGAASMLGNFDTSSLSAVCKSISESINSDICVDNECAACLSEQIEYAECSGPPLADILISLSDLSGIFGSNETAVASMEEEGETCEIKVTECSAGVLSFAGIFTFTFAAAIGTALMLN